MRIEDKILNPFLNQDEDEEEETEKEEKEEEEKEEEEKTDLGEEE